MYYEEKQFYGYWYYRTTPKGDWKPFSDDQYAMKGLKLIEHKPSDYWVIRFTGFENKYHNKLNEFIYK